MKFSLWLFVTAFAAICCTAVNAEQVHLAAVKPTKAALSTSTALSPASDALTDGFPIKLPATVEHPLQAEEARSLAVTGFITKDGDIYEVESADGSDKIEARQAQAEGQHICNYGAVVIYSDVPCKEIQDIKIREVEETPAKETVPVAAALPETQLIENKEEQSNKNTVNRPASMGGQQQPNKRPKPAQTRPNKPSQTGVYKPAHKRPNNSPHKRPTKPAQNGLNKRPPNHPSRPQQPIQNELHKPTLNRPNKPHQNQPIQIVVIRPSKRPNKNKQKRPSSIKTRRVQPFYQAKWEGEDYEDYDDEYYQGYYGGYPAQYYVSEYEDDY